MISVGINYSQMHDSSACIARDGGSEFTNCSTRVIPEMSCVRYSFIVLTQSRQGIRLI
jgi:hypothetical protein